MSLMPRGSLFDSDRFFNDFFTPVTRESATNAAFFAPRVDVKDREDHYEISAELPGVKKEDIQVRLADGVLTLEAESRAQVQEEEGGKLLRQERRYGKFMRSFNLGTDVAEADISASYVDGVLTVLAPKVKEVVPQERRIEIH